jgi:hypothetical protein
MVASVSSAAMAASIIHHQKRIASEPGTAERFSVRWAPFALRIHLADFGRERRIPLEYLAPEVLPLPVGKRRSERPAR